MPEMPVRNVIVNHVVFSRGSPVASTFFIIPHLVTVLHTDSHKKRSPYKTSS